MVCPWPFMAALEDYTPKPPENGKSFAQSLSGSCDIHLTQLPPKVIMGDTVRIKITQKEYEYGIADCRTNLHGRVTLNKGDTPLTTQALKLILSSFWPNLLNWTVIPLGKGFFEFKFGSIEDMRKIWALGVVNLKPGILRFYCWSRDFKPHNQAQTHAQVWVRLMQLPQEYWRKQTLFEIASGLGTPLTIDESTLSRRFGLFARILVDVDLSSKLFEITMVEREGHALSINVQYEKLPPFCAQCKMMGHSIQTCKKILIDDSTTVQKNYQRDLKTNKQFHDSLLGNKPTQTTEIPLIPQIFQTEPITINSNVPNTEIVNSENVVMSMEQGRAKDDVAVPAIMQDLSQDPTLALHNSFTILTEELDIPAGEASLAEHEHIMAEQVDSMVKEHSLSNTSFGVQLVSNNTDGRNTQLIVYETQPTLSSNVAAIKSVEILKENWGDLASDSDEQSLAHVFGCAMPQPITTYHTSLIADKLPVLKPLVHTAVVCSSEAQKVWTFYKSFGGIIPMRSLSLALFVHQQLETKSKRSRQIDKFHQ